eukprot:jgi/Botrbrau1/16303/Bobra.0066s0072.1
MDLDWRDYSLVETRASAVLAARVENVWATLCDFGQFGEYLSSIGMNPMGSNLLPDSSSNNVGARRAFTCGPGTLHEELTAIDHDRQTLSYKLVSSARNVNPFPASYVNATTRITVYEVTNTRQTFILVEGRFMTEHNMKRVMERTWERMHESLLAGLGTHLQMRQLHTGTIRVSPYPVGLTNSTSSKSMGGNPSSLPSVPERAPSGSQRSTNPSPSPGERRVREAQASFSSRTDKQGASSPEGLEWAWPVPRSKPTDQRRPVGETPRKGGSPTAPLAVAGGLSAGGSLDSRVGTPGGTLGTVYSGTPDGTPATAGGRDGLGSPAVPGDLRGGVLAVPGGTDARVGVLDRGSRQNSLSGVSRSSLTSAMTRDKLLRQSASLQPYEVGRRDLIASTGSSSWHSGPSAPGYTSMGVNAQSTYEELGQGVPTTSMLSVDPMTSQPPVGVI